MGGDLDAGDQVAGPDHLAVEQGEDLHRVDPVESLDEGAPNVDHAVHRGEQVHPALGRAARRQARSGDGRRESERRLVLVEVARLHDEHGDPVACQAAVPAHDDDPGRGKRVQVGAGQPPALGPAGTADGEVPGEDRPGQVNRRAAARDDPFEPHPPTGQSPAASAASSARRV